MAARYLLDTNICIYLHRKQPASVVARFEKLNLGEAAISVVTYGELAFGAFKHPIPERGLSKLIWMAGLIPALAMPASAGEVYGRLRAGLGQRGELIGNNDLWIAAHALASGLTLVTNNEREFRRIEGLKIENWTK